jgi:hypothetical protein
LGAAAVLLAAVRLRAVVAASLGAAVFAGTRGLSTVGESFSEMTGAGGVGVASLDFFELLAIYFSF